MITKETVNYIASLSRLHIDEAENAGFVRNLEDILQYVAKLNKLDVAGVLPTSHVLKMENVFRDDKVSPSLTQQEALSFAIESHAGHYKVPKVIE
ncbi:MAG: Asp-tRNA(Asn)/Glu-tRNA(Gln) amidotransferase subunit GatC [Candidatus Omnitrophica bacterium]|nr:Asp-tRNA(Asn)/Glu-tRNA(Gln) amidotransferase subunit GatC [Candidatus Omnitrophota bacterium]